MCGISSHSFMNLTQFLYLTSSYSALSALITYFFSYNVWLLCRLSKLSCFILMLISASFLTVWSCSCSDFRFEYEAVSCMYWPSMRFCSLYNWLISDSLFYNLSRFSFRSFCKNYILRLSSLSCFSNLLCSCNSFY